MRLLPFPGRRFPSTGGHQGGAALCSVITAFPMPLAGLEVPVKIDALPVIEEAPHVITTYRDPPPVGLHTPGVHHLGHPSPHRPVADRNRPAVRVGAHFDDAVEQLSHLVASSRAVSVTNRCSIRKPR